VSALPIAAFENKTADFNLFTPFIILISSEIARGRSAVEDTRGPVWSGAPACAMKSALRIRARLSQELRRAVFCRGDSELRVYPYIFWEPILWEAQCPCFTRFRRQRVFLTDFIPYFVLPNPNFLDKCANRMVYFHQSVHKQNLNRLVVATGMSRAG
jgi:hypothetical protein